MQKYAEYIKEIEIDSLWSGKKHVCWELHRQVNILSGINGVGKSTILNKVVRSLARGGDRPLMSTEITDKIDASLVTELDWQIYKLQRKYLDYQVNIGNRMIQALQKATPEAAEEAQRISQPKRKFQDLIDDLFSETGKKIVRTENEIRFEQIGETLMPYQLSSGEKQMLVILLTVLIEDGQNYVLFMDEPEVSLHVEWQKRLIDLILELNPNVQIILTTHSPAVIMNGWLDNVTEVSEITEDE